MPDRPFPRAPAALAALAAAAGIALGARAPFPPALTALTSLVLLGPATAYAVHDRLVRRAAATSRARPGGGRARRLALDVTVLAALALGAAGLHTARHRLVRPGDLSLLSEGSVVGCTARVIESRASSGGGSVLVAAVPERGDAPSGLAWVTCPGRPPARGALVRVRGRLARPGGRRNPGAFDFSAYLAGRGAHAVIRARDVRTLAPPRGAAALALRLEAAIESSLGGEPGALLAGLLLGRADEVPEDLHSALRRSGAVHVLAVSGLHVGFLVLIATTLLRAGGAPPRPARLLVLPFLLGFVLVVGPRPSVVRAAVTASALLVSASLERRANPLNALGLAALVVMLLRPGALFELGFRLSFGAAGSIVVLYAPLRRWIGRAFARLGRPGRLVADSLAVSTAAQLGAAPSLLGAFGTISVAAPVANLAVVPLAAFAVASGAAMLVARPFSPVLARVLSGSAWASLRAMSEVARSLGSLGWSQVCVGARFWSAALLGAAGVAAAGRVRGRRGGVLAACALSSALGLIAAHLTLGPGRSRARIVFLDVGQGDAALLELPGRRAALIDAGPGGVPGRRDVGRDVVSPLLAREGITRLDALVVTHGHADHAGGVGAVLDAAAVDLLALPPGGRRESPLDALADRAARSGARVAEFATGDTIVGTGGYCVVVVGPDSSWTPRVASENDRSIVGLFRAGPWGTLLTGDIEKRGESAVVASGQGVAADLLKVPHHGAATSSGDCFLDAVRPRVAVISVGAGNRYGHPSGEALSRLSAGGTIVFRTDLDGAVVVDFGRSTRVRAVASGREVILGALRTAGDAARAPPG